MSEKFEGHTPEERRAWIESITGFSDGHLQLQKLKEAIGSRRSKMAVLEIAAATLEQKVTEVDGKSRVGDFLFEFDGSENLKAISFSVTDNQVVIQSKGVWI